MVRALKNKECSEDEDYVPSGDESEESDDQVDEDVSNDGSVVCDVGPRKKYKALLDSAKGFIGKRLPRRNKKVGNYRDLQSSDEDSRSSSDSIGFGSKTMMHHLLNPVVRLERLDQRWLESKLDNFAERSKSSAESMSDDCFSQDSQESMEVTCLEYEPLTPRLQCNVGLDECPVRMKEYLNNWAESKLSEALMAYHSQTIYDLEKRCDEEETRLNNLALRESDLIKRVSQCEKNLYDADAEYDRCIRQNINKDRKILAGNKLKGASDNLQLARKHLDSASIATKESKLRLYILGEELSRARVCSEDQDRKKMFVQSTGATLMSALGYINSEDLIVPRS